MKLKKKMSKASDLNTDWRKVASTIYRKPVDSKIYGSVELDVTELERFIADKRKEGLKITLTHILTLIVGRAFQTEIPELNAYIRRGKVVRRTQIDAMVSVLQANEQMGSVRIESTDKLTLEEISVILNDKIQQARKNEKNETLKNKNLLASIPWPFRAWFFLFYKFYTINLGFSLPFSGLTPNSFGSYVISNIGSIGLDLGYGALLPSGNVSMVLILGGVKKKPVVIQDKLAIRSILSLSITLDHRVVDASHGGKLFRYIKYMIKNPQLLEKPNSK